MLMQFSDTPFPEGAQLFPARETVWRYLQDYASDINSMIRFGNQVVDVRPLGSEELHVWEVTTRVAAEGVDEVERFDAVIAANGHCDWPMLPHIEGLDAWSKEFPESLYHSVSYKNAKAFENKVSRHFVGLLDCLFSKGTALLRTSLIGLACPSRRRRPFWCRHWPSGGQSMRTTAPHGANREISLPD